MHVFRVIARAFFPFSPLVLAKTGIPMTAYVLPGRFFSFATSVSLSLRPFRSIYHRATAKRRIEKEPGFATRFTLFKAVSFCEFQ